MGSSPIGSTDGPRYTYVAGRRSLAHVSTDRPSARLPSGFTDARADDALARQALIEQVVGVYRLHGFEALETPAIEYLDALGKHLPDLPFKFALPLILWAGFYYRDFTAHLRRAG